MKVNYLLKGLVVAFFVLVATSMYAKKVTVEGADRAAFGAAWDQVAGGDTILIKESIIWDDSQFGINKRVVIQGEGDGIEIKAAEGYTMRMFDLYGNGDGKAIVFENISFTANNQGNETGGEKDGGICRVLQGQVQFKNCTFKDSYSANRGGAVFVDSGNGREDEQIVNAIFTNCLFTGNTSEQAGGAVYANIHKTNNGLDQTLTFINCVFEKNNNKNNRGSSLHIAGNNGLTKLFGCVIKENVSGTAVYNPPAEEGANGTWTRTGSGGCIVADNQANIYFEGSSIVNNINKAGHGGVMFAMGQPKVTFVNTTVANNVMEADENSMFFCDAVIDLKFINCTVAGNKAGENGGPNDGNTTGIRIAAAGSKLTLHNTIVVGNTANNGHAVDLNIQGAVNSNPAGAFDIQNSIVGRVLGPTTNSLEAKNSYINFYERGDELDVWKSKDISGVNWNKGLTVSDDGQTYYSLRGSSKAIDLGNPALLAAYIDPLVDQIGTTRKSGFITSGAVEFTASEDACLDVKNLTYIPDGTSYDPATQTITYSADWKYAGWEWAEYKDFSEFDNLTVHFDASGLPDLDDPAKIQFIIVYKDGRADGDTEVEVRKNATSATIELDPAKAAQVWRVGLKSQAKGTIILKDVCFGYTTEEGCMDLGELTFIQDGTSYDPATKTITYSADWKHAGWEWEQPQDFSKYQKVRFEFDGTGLPGANENPGATKIQLIVMYDGGRFDGDEEVEVRNNVREAEVMLGVRGDAKKVKKIAIKSQSAGTIILKSVCLLASDIPPVDLVLTKIRLEPENPVPGDEVTFFATVKNASEFDSPSNIKHGVAFFVNNSVVAWSDTFMGPLAAGEEIELEANGGPDGPIWKCGADPEYKIKAHVNDQREIVETNYENDILEQTLTVEGTSELVIADITWEPNSPSAKDQVVFTLVVENKGTINIPTGTKSVEFYVNNEVVTWNRTFSGAINAGETVKVTANGGTEGPIARFNYWVAVDGTHTVKGTILDESFEKTLQIGESGLEDIKVAGGKVLINNGTLYLVNYPTVSVGIYNLLGQRIANYDAISDKINVNLPVGVYVVKVTSEGKAFTHKVLVK